MFTILSKETPRAIRMDAGQGHLFQKAMDVSIKDLRRDAAALQSEDYENSVNACLSENNDKQSQLYSQLEKFAKKQLSYDPLV